MTLLQRFQAWRCRKFGHSFKLVDQLIFQIKTNTINRDLTAKLKCRRCGQVFVHKDAP